MEDISLSTIILLCSAFVIIAITLEILGDSIFTVETSKRKIVQRFGKFQSIANPGLNFKMPIIDRIEEEIDMRVQQLKLEVETKTNDNTFLKIFLSIQYQVTDPEKAYYRLDDPEQQISAYVFDVVRSQVPAMSIDETFEKKNDLADRVRQELSSDMTGFGYEIIGALVTDVEPDARVKAAMNDIVASRREQIAAEARGEAQKILTVKAAEADADARKLHGEGIANQRRAIVQGLQDSIMAFEHATKVDAQEVMNLVLMTNYFDALKEIGTSTNSSTIFLPHSPGALQDLLAQLQGSLVAAKEVRP